MWFPDILTVESRKKCLQKKLHDLFLKFPSCVKTSKMFFFLIRVSHLPAQEADLMLQTALTAAMGGMHEARIPQIVPEN